MSKKSQFFEIDAIIAIGLLIVGLIYVSSFNYPQVETNQYIEFASSSVKLLRSITINDIDSDLSYYLLHNSSLAQVTDRNFSVARQIGIYYFKGNVTLAANLTQTVLDPLIPDEYGYGIWIQNSTDDALVYNRTWPRDDQSIAVSRTMITGLRDSEQAREPDPFIVWPTMLEVRVWI